MRGLIGSKNGTNIHWSVPTSLQDPAINLYTSVVDFIYFRRLMESPLEDGEMTRGGQSTTQEVARVQHKEIVYKRKGEGEAMFHGIRYCFMEFKLMLGLLAPTFIGPNGAYIPSYL